MESTDLTDARHGSHYPNGGRGAPAKGKRVIRVMTVRYVVALLSIAIMAMLSYFTMRSLIVSHQGSAAKINISGRQRMLSQRIGLLSERLIRASDATTFRSIQTDLLTAIVSMERSHRSLSTIGANAMSERMHALYFGPVSEVDKAVVEYLTHAKRFANAEVFELNPEHPELVAMQNIRENLLEDLDTVVLQYQRESDLVVATLRRRATMYSLLALVFLGLSAVLVFQPLVRRVASEMQGIEDARAVLRGILDSTLDAILTTDSGGKVQIFNSAAEQMFGIERSHIQNKRLDEIAIPPEHRKEHHSAIERLLDGRDRPLSRWFEINAQRADGSRFPAEVSVTGIQHRGQTMFTTCLRDITERRYAEEGQLLASRVFESVSQAIMVTDATSHIVAVNPMFCKVTGFSKEEVIGKKPNVLKSGRHDKKFYRRIWEAIAAQGGWQGEIWNRRKNGEVFPEWLSISSINDADGRVLRYVGIFSDITGQKRLEAANWHKANFDELTDLPKRSLFQRHFQQALAAARREGTLVALLFIDLDHFKLVNDSLGHRAGDQLLIEASRRLIASVRETDTVARIGGDEFVAALSGITSRRDVRRVVKKILGSVAENYEIDGAKATISGSVGVAIYPEDSEDAETLFRLADSAMYCAKSNGRDQFCFSSSSGIRQFSIS